MSNPTQEPNASASTHGYQVAGKAATPKSAAGNALQIRGDYGVWDTVANKFVDVNTTSFGTVAHPKLQ